jgi:hypothetical protein
MEKQRWVAVGILAGLLGGHQGWASMIVVPHSSGCDAAFAGNAVASPDCGAATLLFNAAGVVGRPGEVSFGSGFFSLSGRYTTPDGSYDAKSSEMGLGPLFWMATDRWAPWYFGVGLYGAVGASFNFPADSESGVPNRLKSEMSLLTLGLVVGRELAPGLRFGLQVGPNYGSHIARFPSPFGPVAFDVAGFGISGSVGVLYDLDADTRFGLSYRAPGVVFISDDGARVGASGEEVDIDWRTPQSVVFGFARRLGPRLRLLAQGTWTHYPDFEEGEYDFKRRSELDQPFISDARSTFRYGAALGYALTEWLELRAGITREEWMMEASALSPLLYDTSDTMPMLGAGVTSGPWTFDFAFGYTKTEDRRVTVRDQTTFPGRYRFRSDVGALATATYRFGAGGI